MGGRLNMTKNLGSSGKGRAVPGGSGGMLWQSLRLHRCRPWWWFTFIVEIMPRQAKEDGGDRFAGIKAQPRISLPSWTSCRSSSLLACLSFVVLSRGTPPAFVDGHWSLPATGQEEEGAAAGVWGRRGFRWLMGTAGIFTGTSVHALHRLSTLLLEKQLTPPSCRGWASPPSRVVPAKEAWRKRQARHTMP